MGDWIWEWDGGGSGCDDDGDVGDDDDDPSPTASPPLTNASNSSPVARCGMCKRALLITEAQIGIVPENESGNRFSLFPLVESTTTPPNNLISSFS